MTMHPQNARRRFARHGFEALQQTAAGQEALLATFTVTARYGPLTARRKAENRCRAATAADPRFPVRVREVNPPAQVSRATPLQPATPRGI